MAASGGASSVDFLFHVTRPTLKKTEGGAPWVGSSLGCCVVFFVLVRTDAAIRIGQETRGKLWIRTCLIVFRE